MHERTSPVPSVRAMALLSFVILAAGLLVAQLG
jgi:hypothetical protein